VKILSGPCFDADSIKHKPLNVTALSNIIAISGGTIGDYESKFFVNFFCCCAELLTSKRVACTILVFGSVDKFTASPVSSKSAPSPTTTSAAPVEPAQNSNAQQQQQQQLQGAKDPIAEMNQRNADADEIQLLKKQLAAAQSDKTALKLRNDKLQKKLTSLSNQSPATPEIEQEKSQFDIPTESLKLCFTEVLDNVTELLDSIESNEHYTKNTSDNKRSEMRQELFKTLFVPNYKKIMHFYSAGKSLMNLQEEYKLKLQKDVQQVLNELIHGDDALLLDKLAAKCITMHCQLFNSANKMVVLVPMPNEQVISSQFDTKDENPAFDTVLYCLKPALVQRLPVEKTIIKGLVAMKQE